VASEHPDEPEASGIRESLEEAERLGHCIII
jgi:hypothetical protein